jgi:hypothetical protein
VKIFTEQEFRAYVERQYEDQAPGVMVLADRWLARGDSAAVYENRDLGHPDVGACQIVSYGSPAAQLETELPPERLPDIGGRINWRYTLVGTYSLRPAAG